MARSSSTPGAVAVVRVWFESDASGPTFRARLTYSRTPDGPATSVVLTEPAEVLDKLAEWMDLHRAAELLGHDAEDGQ